MKYVLLAIFVLFAAQPLRASLCDICNGQGTTQGSHGGMHDGDMNHADMQDMDCCEHDDTEAPAGVNDSCDSMSHCGACTASVVTLEADLTPSFQAIDLRQYLAGTSAPLNRFKSPAFRPPIT